MNSHQLSFEHLNMPLINHLIVTFFLPAIDENEGFSLDLDYRDAGIYF